VAAEAVEAPRALALAAPAWVAPSPPAAQPEAVWTMQPAGVGLARDSVREAAPVGRSGQR